MGTQLDKKNTEYSQLDKNSTEYPEINSVALVCERTIPIERQPLVGEVSANFCG
jgi:hypothetical protein